jgi:hypothetical protein
MFKKKQKRKKLGTPIINSLTKLEDFIEDNFRQFTPVLNNFFFWEETTNKGHAQGSISVLWVILKIIKLC